MEKVDRAYLKIKESLATLFVHTVTNEARELFRLIDNHLPAALAQSDAARPGVSRFDLFCAALRKISPEELEDRGKYAEIIRESFSRIISDHINDLLKASAGSDPSLSGIIMNTPGIRYQLQGATEQTFRFVSDFSAQCRRRRQRVQIARIIGMIAFAILSVCLIAPLPLLLVREAWAETSILWVLVGGIAVFLIGFASTLSMEHNRHSLEELAVAFESKQGINAKFDNWKRWYA